MTVKTDVSRFQIHDELTAPDDSAPLIKTIQATGGAVTKFVGVLAGAPAVLRAYTRMRSELRSGVLPQAQSVQPGAEAQQNGLQSKMAVNPRTGEIVYVASVQTDTNIDLLTLTKR